MLEDISLDSMYLYNFYYYSTDTAHYNLYYIIKLTYVLWLALYIHFNRLIVTTNFI